MTSLLDKPSKQAQLEELRRELKMRQQVYPRWVSQGRMTKEQMHHRVTCLIEVIADFEARHSPASQQGSLGI
jgi:hypothetical protein